MKNYLLIFLLNIICLTAHSQAQEDNILETEATITDIDFRINGRTSVSLATVNYTTRDGVVHESIVKLAHIPFMTSIYSVGDPVTVRYREENPMLLTTPFLDFLNSYALYILIFIGIVISGIRILKKRTSQ